MRTIVTIALTAALTLGLCKSAMADRNATAAALLYLDQSGWEQASGEAKSALAADFMRVFCGNPAMSAAELVGCLDRGALVGPIFERAMACVGTVPPGGQ